MRYYTLFVSLALMSAVFAGPSAGAASGEQAATVSAVKLTINSTSKAWWMGGRHIPLTITITNDGVGAIKFRRPETYVMPDSVIDLSVTDSTGKHPDRLIGGLYRTGGDLTDYVHLVKGASYTIDLDKAGICNEYETLASGRYTLRFTLKYADADGHARSTSKSISNVEVRDVRDYAVSSIAVVTPDFGKDSKLVDPNSTARAAVVAAPGGAYWMAYWIERDPIVTDNQVSAPGLFPTHAIRKWVTTLYWLGRVQKSSLFEVARKTDNDLVVTFTDINGTNRAVEIDHFWAAPKYVKGPAEPPSSNPVTIDL